MPPPVTRKVLVGNGLMATDTLPDILAVQPVAVIVATTVYVPGTVISPKLMADPVPAAAPNRAVPLNSW